MIPLVFQISIPFRQKTAVRDFLKAHYIGMNHDFRFRGEGHSRIEALSDAAFALALTLLIISQKVPANFRELQGFVMDLFPFAICITLIMLLWHEHFVFFLRYGFRNSKIVFLNSILLFLILFYVYPLKFLSQVIFFIFIMPFIGGREKANQYLTQMISPQDVPELMILYGVGAGIIFLVFSIMYYYAYTQRHELKLSPLENFDTVSRIFLNMLFGVVPLLSATMAFLGILIGSSNLSNLAGMAYILYWPSSYFFWKIREKKRRKLIG